MATYAVGDIQGCFRTFQRLLAHIAFDARHDELYLLGDLVGRGANALDVLRFAHDAQARVHVLLGNHDLALVAFGLQLAAPHAHDRLGEVLSAPDADVLLSWLRTRPLLYRVRDVLLVHAGVLPTWSEHDILTRALDAQQALAGAEGKALLQRFLRLPGAAAPSAAQAQIDETLQVLTCVRTLSEKGAPFAAFKGELAKLPADLTPWFRWPAPAWAPLHVVCGHWSALGLHQEHNVTALDGGCVWGRSLCAMRLEDRATFSVESVEADVAR